MAVCLERRIVFRFVVEQTSLRSPYGGWWGVGLKFATGMVHAAEPGSLVGKQSRQRKHMMSFSGF